MRTLNLLFLLRDPAGPRGLFLLTLLAALALSAGCGTAVGGTSDPIDDVVLNARGFNQYAGNTMYVKVVEQDDNDPNTFPQPVMVAPRTITNGAFTVRVPNAIQEGRMYNIDFWVDTNSDGILDRSPNGSPAGVDRSWRIQRMAGTEDMVLDFTADENWTDITPF